MEITCEAKDLRVILTGIVSHTSRDETRSFDSLIEVKREGSRVSFEATDGFRAFHRVLWDYGDTNGENGKGYLHLNEVKAALALMPKMGNFTIAPHNTGATWPDLSRVAKLDGEGVCFNTKYLRDALMALKDSEYVTIEVHKHEAGVIRPCDESGKVVETDYILVMPMYTPRQVQEREQVEEPANVG